MEKERQKFYTIFKENYLSELLKTPIFDTILKLNNLTITIFHRTFSMALDFSFDLEVSMQFVFNQFHHTDFVVKAVWHKH